MITTIDGRSLEVNSPLVNLGSVIGDATLVSTTSSWSAERVGLMTMPVEQLLALEASHGVIRVDSASGGIGTVVVGALPSSTASALGLAPDLRIGAWLGRRFACYGFFSSPLNRVEDVNKLFTNLGVVEVDNGLIVDTARWTVLLQRYGTMLDGVHVTCGEPQGRPAKSFQRVPAGDAWIDGSAAQMPAMVLESKSVRISLAPVPLDPGAPAQLTPGSEPYARAVRLLESIRAASWTTR